MNTFFLILSFFCFASFTFAINSYEVENFGTISILSGAFLQYSNVTDTGKLIWQNIPSVSQNAKSHFHLFVSNFLFLAAGILVLAQFGCLRTRRNALYYFDSFLILGLWFKGHHYFSLLTLWGVLHSVAHHHWPFITIHGLNIKATAFPDIVVHLVMHAIVHHGAISLGVSWPTQVVSTLILIGCIVNCYYASYMRVDTPLFVMTSSFQALSSGSWVGYLLSLSSEHQGGFFFELVLWTFWTAALTNWFLFKNSIKWLKKLFTISYLDTLFIIPVWIYILNNWPSSSFAHKFVN